MKKGLIGFPGTLCMGLLFLLLTVSWVGAETTPPEYSVAALDQLDVLDLDTAAKTALAENPSLKAAQARVTQAAQLVKQASAPYWPQLELFGGYSQVTPSQRAIDEEFEGLNLLIGSLNDNMGTTIPPISIPDTEAIDYYQIGIKAKWLIFDGFSREFSLAAARHGEKATISARDDAQRLLLSAVTSAYLQAQLAQENVLIAKADEAFNQRLLTEAKLRYDVGTGALSDVLNFQVRVNAAKTKLIQEERGYQAGLIGLAALIGVPQGRMPEQIRLADLGETPSGELMQPQQESLVDQALQRRPDLKQSEWMVQIAEAGVKTAQSGYYPTLALEASHTGEREEDADFSGDDFGDTIGVGLTWNIFAGGLTRARCGEARAKLFEAEKTRNDARIKVTAQINQIITQINANQQQLVLQESNTKLVQRQRDLVEKEYKAGVGSLVRLNEAQKDLTVAQAQLALSRAALRLSWYELRTATSEILEMFK